MKSKPRFTKFKSTETAGKDRKWYVVDAKDRVLGRLASQIASVLRGKTTAAFSPHIDNGHFVVVINAEKIALTGKKMSQKLYRQHSGYVGGLKEETAERVLARKPENVIRPRMERFFTPFNYTTITFFTVLIAGAFNALLLGALHHKMLRRFTR